jgi:hypothetical protein
MMDLVYLGIGLAFFLLTLGLTKACESLMEGDKGRHS